MNIANFNPKPFYMKLALVLIALIAIVYIAILAKEVLSPLIFGLLFSILLLPFASFLERKLKLNRSAASGISVLLLLLCIGGLLMLIGSQVSDLSQDLPQLKEQVFTSFHNMQEWVTTKFHINVNKQMTYLQSATDKIATSSPSIIGSTVMSLSSILLFLVFVILDTFFMLFYRRRLFRFLLDVFNNEYEPVVYDIVERIQYIIRKYLVGILLEMATVAIVCCTAFLLLGIKYAILLGLITALFNIVPYIGIFSALLLNVIITFATTAVVTKVLFVVITVVAMHLIDSNVLLPVIVGSKVRINAFVTLIGVVVGEMIWGIAGMFLSIPLIAITKIIFDRVESLKAWGQLMGDENIEAKSLKLKRLQKQVPKVNIES